MDFLYNFDVTLFRFINDTLRHPVLDRVMPFLSGNDFFIPVLFVVALLILARGGVRGRLFIGALALIILLGDSILIASLKDAFHRPRPFNALSDVHLLVGRGSSASFPSSHAACWFAASVICAVYYRRWAAWVLTGAVLVSYSRIYVGAHYPSDVLGGALLGGGYAATLLWTINRLWMAFVRRWAPDLSSRLPSLLDEPPTIASNSTPSPSSSPALPDVVWVRLGYLVIGLMLVGRLVYLASGKIELSEDETYQWLWSKHPALSYYSKPPMIVWLHTIGTSLWGDTMFGVRFCSPLIAATLSIFLLRFLASTMGGKPAFWLILLLHVIPLPAVGATLITVDPPLVLFWTLAMIIGWRAVQPGGTTAQWIWSGFFTGLAALSKYAGLYQLLCWVFIFALWPAARIHLRKPGPWLAVLVAVLCLTPVFAWNAQNEWVTLGHVRFNASRGTPWEPSLRFVWDFIGAQAVLLNPVVFVAMILAMWNVRKIRLHRNLALFFFCMGAPVFLGYFAFTLYKRVYPNWIAPSIIPLLCLTALYWYEQWRDGSRWVKPLLIGAFGIGLPLVVVLHDTRLIGKATHWTLPVEFDPLRRVQGWHYLAQVVDKARQELKKEGKPVFIVANHYGFASEVAFSLPESRTTIKTDPFVYVKTTPYPESQFFFWPGYAGSRTGQNAIFLQEVDVPPLRPDEQPSSLRIAQALPAPTIITQEFRSVVDLGVFPVYHRERIVRWVQLFACRELL